MRVGGGGGGDQETQESLSLKPVVETKTVYEARPVVRDLRKEAVAFVPAAVRMKLDKTHGVGGLMEPEEADRLEKEGYLQKSHHDVSEPQSAEPGPVSTTAPRQVTMEEVEDDED